MSIDHHSTMDAFTFVPALKAPYIIHKKLQASWKRSIYMSGFFPQINITTQEVNAFHDKDILP